MLRTLSLGISPRPIPSFAVRFGNHNPSVSMDGAQQQRDNALWKEIVDQLNQAGDGESIRVGRDDTRCNVVLQDPCVSRVHARFLRKGNDFYVQDLGTPIDGGTQTPGSLNGTWWVDDRKLVPDPQDIRGEGRDVLSFSVQEFTYMKERQVRIREKAPAQMIHNGDRIFIQGHIFHVEGLKPRSGTEFAPEFVEPTLKTRREVAEKELTDLQTELMRLLPKAQDPQARQQFPINKLMLVRMLLSKQVRFDIYFKLRKIGVPQEKALALVLQLKAFSTQIMQAYDGVPQSQMSELLKQSVVSLGKLQDELGPDGAEGRLFGESFCDVPLPKLPPPPEQ